MSRQADIFQALVGEWKLHRQIVPFGSLTGGASFVAQSAARLHYTETGILRLDGGAGSTEARRCFSYRWEHGAINVYFADGPQDGQLFHVLSFDDAISATASHHCVADLYRTTYRFELPARFSVEHHVTGPHKRYVSTSLYTRAVDSR